MRRPSGTNAESVVLIVLDIIPDHDFNARNHQTLSKPPSSCVTILMAMYDGAPWLYTQLESIRAQDHPEWRLIVSDDGSQDGSVERLLHWAAHHAESRVELRHGPRSGPAPNFLSMLANLEHERGDFVALADQDDQWLPGKLSRALHKLRAIPADRPALYCGATVICDRDLRPIRRSRIPRREPAFVNALVQNIAGGNTMVLNPAAAQLVKYAAREAREIVLHDWWIYQMVSGAGGTVIFDTEPQVHYRQHARNQVGSNDRLIDSVRRIQRILAGRAREWMDINLAALERSGHRLTAKNRSTVLALAQARRLPAWKRVPAVHRLGLYAQTHRGNFGFRLAVVLARI